VTGDIAGLIALAAALAAAGAVTGVLAGLFGVGGGAIIVPVLYEVLGITGVPDGLRMPLAVGTSLAIIVPTSLRSARAHYLRGAVDMSVLRLWAAPILIGVATGALVARYAQPWVFQLAFVMVAAVISVKLLAGKKDWRLAPDLPSNVAMRFCGLAIGLVSALMGIGGGAVSTLFLTVYGRAIRNAVATSAGVGVLISLPGTLGYVLAGWGRAGLPADAIGFVSLLGLALVAPLSLLTAPVGVKLAHTMPPRRLEILFGAFLLLVCARFLAAILLDG
jgi:uncharacterized protein